MTFTFEVLSAPRTKKTSPRIVTIGGRNGAKGFQKILPSLAHEVWFKNAMNQAILIRTMLREQGAELPIEKPVRVLAVWYRERLGPGDLNGYQQALGDYLQAEKYSKSKPGALIPKLIRKGAGIIADDRLISRWHGDCRLELDRENPRIEVSLEIME